MIWWLVKKGKEEMEDGRRKEEKNTKESEDVAQIYM